jgi:hypothetical protein
MPPIRPLPLLRALLVDGASAALLSTAALAWRGRAETGSRVAAINASSHVLHGRDALRRNAASWRYTGGGLLVHGAASCFWAALYRAVRSLRRQPGTLSAVSDAAAVSALAAVVDLNLVPERLTPGFERRLKPASVVLVYVAFAAGLALGGIAQRRN